MFEGFGNAFLVWPQGFVVLAGWMPAIQREGMRLSALIAAALPNSETDSVSIARLREVTHAAIQVIRSVPNDTSEMSVIGVTIFGKMVVPSRNIVRALLRAAVKESSELRECLEMFHALLAPIDGSSESSSVSDLPSGWLQSILENSTPNSPPLVFVNYRNIVATIHMGRAKLPGTLPAFGFTCSNSHESGLQIVSHRGISEGHEAQVTAGLAAVMDELAYGVAITDRHGTILHANRAARLELSRSRSLLSDGGTLYARTQSEATKLKNALAKASEGKRSLFIVQSPDKNPLPVTAIPYRQAASQPLLVALVFARSSVCEALMLCLFARSHSLTTTEEQVLSLLCMGFTGPQVAKRMNLAVCTIRSHVRNLVSKTNSSGIRELVNMVAVLPPVVTSSSYDAAQ